MDSKHTVRYVEKDFTITNGNDQLLVVVHSLMTDGDACRFRVFVEARDIGASVNYWVGNYEYLAQRQSGTVTLLGITSDKRMHVDDGGILSGIGDPAANGDDIEIALGFDWASGTQYAIGRARIELDVLA